MQAPKKALKTKSRNWFPVSPWPAGLCSVVSWSTEGFLKAFPKPEPLSLGRDQAEFPSPEHGLGGTDRPKLLLHSGCIANEQRFWKLGHRSVKPGQTENSEQVPWRDDPCWRAQTSRRNHFLRQARAFPCWDWFYCPWKNPLSGFCRRQELIFFFSVPLLNVNAHRRSGETRNAKDQELLLWKRQDGFESLTLHLQYVTLPIYKVWG